MKMHEDNKRNAMLTEKECRDFKNIYWKVWTILQRRV